MGVRALPQTSDYGFGMLRTISVVVATTLLLASCAGSDEADDTPTTSAAPTPTAEVAVETTTTEAAPPTTTTTEPTPTTTEVDEEALIAEVEAAYFAGYDAYHRAIFDPANEELRAALAEFRHGDALANVLGILDDLVELNAVARENPDFGPSRGEITGPVRFTNDAFSEASIVVCELNAEWFVEPEAGPNGEDSILRTDVIRSDLTVLLQLIEGSWKVVAGGAGSDQIGVETCD